MPDDMKDICELLKKDRFAAVNGIELLKVEPGYAEAKMVIGERHLNGYGSVMGGAIFTLADYTFAAASNAKGGATVSCRADISFFRAPRGKFLVAKAREVFGGARLCTYNVDIFDAEGTLAARLTGTGYVTRRKKTAGLGAAGESIAGIAREEQESAKGTVKQ